VDAPFIAMEFLEGVTLRNRIAGRPVHSAEAAFGAA